MGLSEIVWGKKTHGSLSRPLFSMAMSLGLAPLSFVGFSFDQPWKLPHVDGGLVRLENMENHRTK
jgi:hypothetical protein